MESLEASLVIRLDLINKKSLRFTASFHYIVKKALDKSLILFLSTSCHSIWFCRYFSWFFTQNRFLEIYCKIFLMWNFAIFRADYILRKKPKSPKTVKYSLREYYSTSGISLKTKNYRTISAHLFKKSISCLDLHEISMFYFKGKWYIFLSKVLQISSCLTPQRQDAKWIFAIKPSLTGEPFSFTSFW